MSAIWVLSSSSASRVSISEITPSSWSTFSCWFMVIQPVCRHGLEIEAFAKHTFLAPPDLYSEVSVISPSMYCRYGSAGSPSNVAPRCSSCSSKTAWSNHSVSSPESSVSSAVASLVAVSVGSSPALGSDVWLQAVRTASKRAAVTASGPRMDFRRISVLLCRCPAGVVAGQWGPPRLRCFQMGRPTGRAGDARESTHGPRRPRRG